MRRGYSFISSSVSELNRGGMISSILTVEKLKWSTAYTQDIRELRTSSGKKQ